MPDTRVRGEAVCIVGMAAVGRRLDRGEWAHAMGEERYVALKGALEVLVAYVGREGVDTHMPAP